MPWPKEHKQNTRERIVEAAAAAFRQNGADKVGVSEIMQEAGLTHGGFYAHFASKEDLLIEALRYASEEANELLETESPARGESSAPRLLAAALTYLSPYHLEHVERGCPIAALGPELIRSSQKVRRSFATEITRRLERLYELATGGVKKRRQQAAGALACMVGGLIVARGLKEPERLEFLKDCQFFLREALSMGQRIDKAGK
jgi:TetR/AcrR family transcriptional regulator, transcriptional repressor for nem operon